MDRRFLSAYLPDIENFLHYRSIDVSSVKELAKRWYPRRLAARPHKTGSHRALDDIRESVAELAFYRQMCFMPPESAESAVVDGPAASGVPPRP
jgi:oligoribonuclease